MNRFLRFRRPSRPTLFAILMAASLVLVLLPGDPLRSARNVTQIMAPLQLVTLQATRSATGTIESWTRSVPSIEEHAGLTRAKQALEGENIALRQQVNDLQSQIDELSGLRRQGLPAHTVLIPARVISLDAAPGRDAVVVGKGDVQNVERDDWVVSHLVVDAGGEEGVPDASAVLARQCLIGWVEQVAPLTSRVVLLSDRLARKPMVVHIASGSAHDGAHRLLIADGRPIPFALEGAGGGRMVIRDVAASLVDAGRIRVGDLVTSTPDDPRLPLPMVIGEIQELTLDRDNPVCYDAVVRYRIDPKRLSHVFIANLSRARIAPAPARP